MIHRLSRHLVMELIMRLLVWSFTSKWVGTLMGWWVGRVVGKMVILRVDRLSVLVARLHWWWLEGRIVGRVISEQLNRRLVLVGRVTPILRRRMNKWAIQRMGWSLDIRMMFNMMLGRMGNNSRWCH